MKIFKPMIMIAALLTGFSVFAGEDGKEPKKETVKQETVQKDSGEKAQAAPGGAGMVVSIDPSRGTIDSNPQLSDEMRDALERMVNTSSEGLVEQRLADGTVLVDLQGRFQSAMVATIGPDGKVSTNCFSKSPEHKHSDSCNVVKKKDNTGAGEKK